MSYYDLNSSKYLPDLKVGYKITWKQISDYNGGDCSQI